jgi:hypothetical protein
MALHGKPAASWLAGRVGLPQASQCTHTQGHTGAHTLSHLLLLAILSLAGIRVQVRPLCRMA